MSYVVSVAKAKHANMIPSSLLQRLPDAALKQLLKVLEALPRQGGARVSDIDY